MTKLTDQFLLPLPAPQKKKKKKKKHDQRQGNTDLNTSFPKYLVNATLLSSCPNIYVLRVSL